MCQCRYRGCSPYRDLARQISCDIYRIQNKLRPEFRVFLPCTSIYVFFPLEVFEISGVGVGGGWWCCRVTVLQWCRVQFRVKMDPLHASYTARTEHWRESVCSSVRSTIPLCQWRNSRTDRTNFHETLHRRAELMCSDSIQTIGLNPLNTELNPICQ